MTPERTSLRRFELTPAAARRLAAAFTVFLFLFESYVVRVEYVGEGGGSVSTGGDWSWLPAVLFLAGSIYFVHRFTAAALSSSWAFRIVYFLIFATATAAEYSYQKALGRFSRIIDIELAVATSYEQKIESIAMYFGYAAVFPLVVLLVVLIFTKSSNGQGFRHLVLVNSLFVVVLLAGSAASVTQFPTLSPVAFYRTNIDFVLRGPIAKGEWGSDLTGIELKRNSVTAPDLPAGHVPDNNIVLVIGESMRGDHFSLNGYGRPTTPFLDDLHTRGILHNWGIAAAASTGSHTSFNSIVTGLTPDDFPDLGHEKLNRTPNLFQYAKAMGYKTWFIDGQMNYFWSGIKDDRRFIDQWIGVDGLRNPATAGDWDIDVEIARRVNKVVSGSKGNFILIFAHGSHVPYHFNFPPDQAVWQPSYANDDRFNIPGKDQLQAVANAYDNSIRYNVNSFFENLIDDYERIPNNSIIIYTGDHGQTLFANGKASHSGYTREEATVPLFIIGGLGVEVDTTFKASHYNLYPTILELMNYPADLLDRKLPLSLLKAKAADSRPRYFNPAYGEKIAFD